MADPDKGLQVSLHGPGFSGRYLGRSDTRPVAFHDDFESPLGGPLACPACGSPHVQLIGTPVLGGPEVVQTDEYEGLLGFRGNEWQHRAACENCEAVLTLCLAFHKGCTYSGWHLG